MTEGLGSGVGTPSKKVGDAEGALVGVWLGEAVGEGVASAELTNVTVSPEELVRVATLLRVTVVPVTATTVVPSEMPYAPETLSPTAIVLFTEGTSRYTEAEPCVVFTTVTIVWSIVYVGVRVGATVGVDEGDAVGMGVGAAVTTVKVRATVEPSGDDAIEAVSTVMVLLNDLTLVTLTTAVLENTDPETVEPTTMPLSSDTRMVVLPLATTASTTTLVLIYEGASVGDAVGAAEGEALGAGVGLAGVVTVSATMTVSLAALLIVTLAPLTDTTVEPELTPVPETMSPTFIEEATVAPELEPVGSTVRTEEPDVSWTITTDDLLIM